MSVHRFLHRTATLSLKYCIEALLDQKAWSCFGTNRAHVISFAPLHHSIFPSSPLCCTPYSTPSWCGESSGDSSGDSGGSILADAGLDCVAEFVSSRAESGRCRNKRRVQERRGARSEDVLRRSRSLLSGRVAALLQRQSLHCRLFHPARAALGIAATLI